MRPATIGSVVLALLLSVTCRAQQHTTYIFALTDDPSVCFTGECNSITASGIFTVGALANNTYPITGLVGTMSVGFGDQPVKLGPPSSFGGMANPIVEGSPFWMEYANSPSAVGIFSYASNRSAAGNNLLGTSGLAALKSPVHTNGMVGPFFWYAPVRFVAVPTDPEVTQSFAQLRLQAANRIGARNIELGIGVPAAATLTYWLVREIRSHRKHREAFPAGHHIAF